MNLARTAEQPRTPVEQVQTCPATPEVRRAFEAFLARHELRVSRLIRPVGGRMRYTVHVYRGHVDLARIASFDEGEAMLSAQAAAAARIDAFATIAQGGLPAVVRIAVPVFIMATAVAIAGLIAFPAGGVRLDESLPVADPKPQPHHTPQREERVWALGTERRSQPRFPFAL